MSATRNRAPLFGLLAMPVGVYMGIGIAVIPALLAAEGAAGQATVGLRTILPLICALAVLWTPLTALASHRQTFFYATLIAAALAWMGIANFRFTSLLPWVALSFGAIGASVANAAAGGLLAGCPHEVRAAASAWFEAGKFVGSGFGAAALLAALTFGSFECALVAALLMTVPAVLGLAMAEGSQGSRSSATAHFRAVRDECRVIFRNRSSPIGLLLLTMPGGVGAAQFFFHDLAASFGVGASTSAWVNGLGRALALTLGALLGTRMPSGTPLALIYGIAGLANATAALILAAADGGTAYVLGCTMYYVTLGCSGAVYVALQADLAANALGAAAMGFGFLTTVGNVPVVVMMALDGAALALLGRRAMMLVDAGGNVLEFVVVMLVWRSYEASRRSSLDSPAQHPPTLGRRS